MTDTRLRRIPAKKTGRLEKELMKTNKTFITTTQTCQWTPDPYIEYTTTQALNTQIILTQ